MLQLDFFFRRRKWYAGQFVRKILPLFHVTEKNSLFFSTVLNKLKPLLQTVIVRNVDRTFLNATIELPIDERNEVDFKLIESFVTELQSQRLKALQSYLDTLGVKSCVLTQQETNAIRALKNGEITFEEKRIWNNVFIVKNTHNILQSEITFGSGTVPYITSATGNNSTMGYIAYNPNLIDKGNCVFIGGKTMAVTYQPVDFYSNDSHNLALYVKNRINVSENENLFLATCIISSLTHKYAWGNSISSAKIKSDVVMVPVSINGEIDFNIMNLVISALKKLCIKKLSDAMQAPQPSERQPLK